ncbi:hypothetical protein [Staphylococcus phage vB_SauM-V1SA22]|nr:hypothetical protein [Staphylococcus phage vB_SauM-V1SA22]
MYTILINNKKKKGSLFPFNLFYIISIASALICS